jgi:hypothetical protein
MAIENREKLRQVGAVADIPDVLSVAKGPLILHTHGQSQRLAAIDAMHSPNLVSGATPIEALHDQHRLGKMD